MDEVLQDLRYGLRALVQRPGFSVVAVATLALGIGANATLFTLLNAVMLRPLPYPDPDRLVILWRSQPQRGQDELPFSFPNYADLKQQAKSFESMGACAFRRLNLTGTDMPEKVEGAIVTADVFRVLGVKPLLGRVFLASEDMPGTPRVAVLSHSLWQRRFGADPDLVGKTILLDGESHQVVGVMPANFKLLSFLGAVEVWTPFGIDPFRDRRYARAVSSMGIFGRLKQGYGIDQAQAEVDTLAAQLERQHPENNRWKVRVVSFHEQAVQRVRRSLLVLLAAVGFVLLIACSNVANLLLARGSARRKEMAIRIALGAGRIRLIRQVLAESILLALAGGIVGLLFSLWGEALLAWLPLQNASHYTPYIVSREQMHLDGTVVAFVLGISLLCSILFGLAPALWTSKTDPQPSLQDAGRSRIPSLVRQPGRSALVIVEVALSMVLLVGAGLMIRSFLRLARVDPGFDPANVLTADVALPQSRYREDSHVIATYQQIIERLRNLPGVQAAGAVEFLPLSGGDSSTLLLIDGQAVPPPGQERRVHYRHATPDYFRAMGIRLIRGRGFTDLDARDARKVAIINETLARRYLPGGDAIGKRAALIFESMRFYPDRAPELDIPLGMREIVGVVADVKHSNLESAPVPEMFIPHSQRPVRDMTLVVRAASDPMALGAALRQEVSAVDKDLPLSNVTTVMRLLSDSVSQQRFNMLLLTLFASMALVLAAVGVYGVLSHSVTQRSREIGIRMALGARSRDVLLLIVRQGMALSGIGIAAGLLGSLTLNRALRALLFEVNPADPAVLAVIALLLTAVALLACYIPARRGTKVDPMATLRCE